MQGKVVQLFENARGKFAIVRWNNPASSTELKPNQLEVWGEPLTVAAEPWMTVGAMVALSLAPVAAETPSN